MASHYGLLISNILWEISQKYCNRTEFCASGSELKPDGSCSTCDVGFYKDNTEDNLMPCTACPKKYTTSGRGSTSVNDCSILICGAGTFINETAKDCELCPRGTYQDQPLKKNCEPCLGQTSTRQAGAQSVNSCEEYCLSGFVRDNGRCVSCNRGFYKDNTVDLFMPCTACNPNFVTPEGIPATSESQCTVPNCLPGTYITGQTCTDCDLGKYQNLPWQTSCRPCPPDKTTNVKGADNINDCQLSCQKGYENPVNTETCVQCQPGFYKDTVGVSQCQPCADFTANKIRISVGTGATSLAECSTLACSPGYFPSGSDCVKCTYGFYQPNFRWTTSCLPCGGGETTYIEGATTVDQCWLDCPAGKEYIPATGQCSPCAVGYYRHDLDKDDYTCTKCSYNLITETVGSTSFDDCDIVDCSELGTYRDNNVCKNCPIGTYQDTIRQTKCKDCANDYTTRFDKRSQQSDCIYNCPAGKEYDVAVSPIPCRDCAQGSYRTIATWTCQNCPDNLRTNGPGADARDDCNIPTCNTGSAFKDGLCQICPKNTYQNQAEQRWPCKACPPNSITSGTGATAQSDCFSPCVGSNNNCGPTEQCVFNIDQANGYECQCAAGLIRGLSGTCADPCSSNNCDVTSEMCITDDTKETGYRCDCVTNFERNSSRCQHKCDRGYCGVNSVCIRSPLSCECTNDYQGDLCLDPPAAASLSNDETRNIMIISICVIVFFLLLLLLIVCIIVRFRSNNYSKSKSDFDERTSIATRSDMPNFAMNPVYSSKTPSIYGASPLRPSSMKTYDNPTIADMGDRAVYTA